MFKKVTNCMDDTKYFDILGVGSGMVSLSAFTAFAPYFDKRKALSVGITASGAGIGTVVLPVILRTLFDNYSFSGALTILGKSLDK